MSDGKHDPAKDWYDYEPPENISWSTIRETTMNEQRIGNVLASAIIYAIGLVIGGTLGIVAGWVIWG